MLLQSRYEYDPKKDLLGKGGFARVYKARDTLLERHVAIKIFNSSGKDQYTVLNEIKKVIQFEHPNLLRYYDVILIEQENSLGESERLEIGVMELANAGDLKDFAKANPNSPILFKLLKDVLEGLTYLHQNGIIHRDLKAQNVLLVEGKQGLTAKISDFGISKDVSAGNQSSSMMVGTIEYMAPEQFSPQKYGIDGKIGSNVDLWSFGIMVHDLLTDSTPFGSRDGNTTAEQIMSSILSTEQPKDFDKLPEPYRTVVKKCLVANAKERIRKASELIQYFENRDSSSNTSSTKQNQAADDQATKVYGKANGPNCSDTQNSSSQEQDDKTKVYGKIGQSQTANDDDATKVYQKGNEQATQTSKAWWKRAGVLATLTIAIVLIAGGGYYKTEYDKQQKIAEAEVKQKKIADSLIQASEAIKKKEYKKAYELLLVAVEDENPSAQVLLGDRYQYGEGIERDDKKAMGLYLKAAEQNDASGQNKVGYLYTFGLGVTQDYKEALKWNLKAAEQNYSKAHEDIGYIYEQGLGVEKDYKKAMDWYLKAAEQNNGRAQFYIAGLYYDGFGVIKDYKKAFEWYLKAAEHSEGPYVDWSEYQIGEFYYYGLGVNQDLKKALEWFLKAAEHNNGNALLKVGQMYQLGQGSPKNLEEAKKWFKKAKDQGNYITEDILKLLQ